MDNKKLLALGREFFGKPIFLLPPDDPDNATEVVVEVSRDERESVAVALIDRSAPHMHYATTEVYIVEEGELTVYVNKVKHLLRPGEQLTILSGEVHWAEGDSTRVRVVARPPWTSADHVLVGTGQRLQVEPEPLPEPTFFAPLRIEADFTGQVSFGGDDDDDD